MYNIQNCVHVEAIVDYRYGVIGRKKQYHKVNKGNICRVVYLALFYKLKMSNAACQEGGCKHSLYGSVVIIPYSEIGPL